MSRGGSLVDGRQSGWERSEVEWEGSWSGWVSKITWEADWRGGRGIRIRMKIVLNLWRRDDVGCMCLVVWKWRG